MVAAMFSSNVRPRKIKAIAQSIRTSVPRQREATAVQTLSNNSKKHLTGTIPTGPLRLLETPMTSTAMVLSMFSKLGLRHHRDTASFNIIMEPGSAVM